MDFGDILAVEDEPHGQDNICRAVEYYYYYYGYQEPHDHLIKFLTQAFLEFTTISLKISHEMKATSCSERIFDNNSFGLVILRHSHHEN